MSESPSKLFTTSLSIQWYSKRLGDPVDGKSVADLRGAQGTRAPPWGSKFFQFHAVFGKIRQIRMLAPPPPGELAPPPRGNPGSATESDLQLCTNLCQELLPEGGLAHLS